jgi:hypothetical protein
MNVPLESLRSKVTTFSRKVIKTAATWSCWWWYGVHLDDNDPDSLAQLCGITSIELDTMFVACGFLLSGKFKREALTNFAKQIRTCDVTMGQPAGFKSKNISKG